MKFNSEDTVVYGNYGLCIIKSIQLISFSPDKPKEHYYVLSPFSNALSTYYIPADKSDTFLRRPLTKAEVMTMLNEAKITPFEWAENRQLRNDSFHRTLSKGVSKELISMLHCLLKRRNYLSDKGKTLSSTDEAIFVSAEKLLCEEFAYSLCLNKNDVNAFICKFIEDNP